MTVGTGPVPVTELDLRRLSSPALKAFCRIASLWQLGSDDQRAMLGGVEPSVFAQWCREPELVLPREILERISYILAIYKALQVLLPEDAAADEWVSKPNDALPFNGKRALDHMLSGRVADLLIVRQYLEAAGGVAA